MSDPQFIRDVLRAGLDCPPLETLAYLMELAKEHPERIAAEEHLKSCPHCGSELAISRKFEFGSASTEEEETVRRIAGRVRRAKVPSAAGQLRNSTPEGDRGRGRLALLAAALAIAAGLVAMVRLKPQQPAATLGEQTEALRSAPLRALAPLDDHAAVPHEFRWTAVNGAARYALTVTEVDRTIVFQAKVETASAPVPNSVRHLIESGTALLWSVRAEDPLGRELASSGVQRFRVQPLQRK